MTPTIVCECGTIVRGGSEHDLLVGARAHMESNHPAVAAQITDEELLALSQEDPQREGPQPLR